MATTVAELIATLGLDSSAFTKGLDQAQSKSSAFSSSISGLATLGGGILAAGFGAAAAGATLLGIELSKDVKAASEAQQVHSQLEAVLKSTGGVAGITAKAAEDLATSISTIAPYDDEAILSSENLLLTFTNIGKDIFPQAEQAIVDMSSALGEDLQSASIQVGKALQDPILGVTALRRVGVNFNEETTKMIKGLVETGHSAEAQAYILRELQTEFGGSAKAAGQTFAGQMKILGTQIGNVREAIGARLIPIITQFIQKLVEIYNSPQVQQFINSLVDSIVNLAQAAVDHLPAFIQAIQNAFGWLMNNQGVIVAIFAVLTAAIIAFIATAVVPLVISLLPVIGIILLIAGAAYILYQAWTNNWGGIQDKVATVWAFLQPIFQQIITWFQTNIPVAVQFLSNLWTNTLVPAFQKVQSFLQTYIMPLLINLGRVIGETLIVAGTALAGLIQNVIVPWLQKMWEWIDIHIMPSLQKFGDWLSSHVAPALEAVGKAISGVIEWLGKMADKISNIELPAWLTPGSPTPFELGLIGIADAMSKVNGIGLPSLSMAGGSINAGGVGGGNVININVVSDGVHDERDIAQKIGNAVNVVLREKGLA